MKVAIIGGGVSGLFCAYYLLKDGQEVTLVDNTATRPKTSSYNAGLITPSIGVAPGIGLGTIISPYFGRAGPIYISLLEVLRNIRWFRIGLRKGLSGYENALTELGAKSLDLYNRLFDEESIEADRIRGILGLYRDKEEAKAVANRIGGRYADDSEALRMGFKNFGGGVVMDEEISINPLKLFDGVKKIVLSLGAELIGSKEAELDAEGKVVRGVSIDGERVRADACLVTAGSWSPRVFEAVRYKPLILPARGLVLLFDTAGEEIVSSPALFEDEGIGVTQHDSHLLRITSFFEMVGFKDRFSEKRRNWILDQARKHIVKFDRLTFVQEGVGFRPCTPDQLPVIGRVPGYANLYIASGHCRLGVTLAPGTGRLIADAISGRNDSMGSSNGNDTALLQQFSPARFSN